MHVLCISISLSSIHSFSKKLLNTFCTPAITMAAATQPSTRSPLSQHILLRGAKQTITIQRVENLVSFSGLVFLETTTGLKKKGFIHGIVAWQENAKGKKSSSVCVTSPLSMGLSFWDSSRYILPAFFPPLPSLTKDKGYGRRYLET